MNPSAAFWSGRRVLVTGHSGFKGAWLTLWLRRLGAEVIGLSLPPEVPSLFEAAGVESLCRSHWVDVRDAEAVRTLVQQVQPDVVLHLAAQALVRRSYVTPLATWHTNVLGTAHLLEALRGSETRVCVVVTTDKVYRQQESAHPYAEGDPLGGHDPYSASKAACELLVESYRLSFLAGTVAVATARAGNVVGGGDWGQDRLIPDAIRAWQTDTPVVIRRPSAVRPWQFVLEPLGGYLRLAERLWDEPALAGAYNFGPFSQQMVPVRDVITLARDGYGRGAIAYGADEDERHEAGLLCLDSSRAAHRLDYRDRWTLPDAIARTVHWYRAAGAGASARALCEADLAAFEEAGQC